MFCRVLNVLKRKSLLLHEDWKIFFFPVKVNRSTEESFGSYETPNSSLERKLNKVSGFWRKKSKTLFPVEVEVAEKPKFFESEISQSPSFAQNFVLKIQYWASEFQAEVGLQGAEERFLTRAFKARLLALKTASKLFERSKFPRSSVTISSSRDLRFKATELHWWRARLEIFWVVTIVFFW